jgi:hypothetical protein
MWLTKENIWRKVNGVARMAPHTDTRTHKQRQRT